MKVLGTAQVVTQTFKNAGRMRDIVGVFVAHGFADLVHRLRLTKFLPEKYRVNPDFQQLPIPERLRLAFEKLGPSFVKFGQLLATRPDLIPDAYVEEFQKLQDRVSTVPFDEIRKQIESELGQKVEDSFESIDQAPLAAASIAQVHSAVLKTGERVVIKVQRPGIDKTVSNDISILRGLAVLMERYLPETKLFNPTGMVDEFFRSIHQELDFHVEANNIRKIKKNLVGMKQVAIPVVYGDLSTARILVLERFEGVRFSDREAILAGNIKPAEIIETGCDAFFHMVLQDGIFHGDLHAGNLFVLKDGRIGIIDFGMVGRLSKRIKESVTTMFIAIMDEDYESLASEYTYISHMTGESDLNRLQKDLMDLISPYIGMAIGEVNIGHILMRSTAVAAQHNLRVPRELMLLFKAIVTIEGLGKKLDPTFDLLSVGNRLAKQALSSRYSKEQVLKDMVVVGRDLQHLAETLPRTAKRFLRKWSQDGFVFETSSKDTQLLANSVKASAHVLALSALGVCLFALGTVFLILNHGPFLWGVPIPATLTLVVAVSVMLHTINVAAKQEKRPQ
ncbi:MAG: AarF/ABC1/UbiB kinase family protein [Bdellovibrionales bacterium]|nr:AarF/ABC1/UbiB kinase family protein [Bdellovibrionales bacterium]